MSNEGLFWLDQLKEIDQQALTIVKTGNLKSVPVKYKMYIQMQLETLEILDATCSEKVYSIASLIRSYTTPRQTTKCK